jgi:hypothetical protein
MTLLVVASDSVSLAASQRRLMPNAMDAADGDTA